MKQALRRIGVTLLLVVVLTAGAAVDVVKAATSPLRGLASWYGRQHHGKKMANGEPFNRFLFTAAHRTFELGTRLRVCLTKTGKCTVVEVTDRGPTLKTRMIDLSEAAAEAIGLKKRGVSRVTIEELD